MNSVRAGQSRLGKWSFLFLVIGFLMASASLAASNSKTLDSALSISANLNKQQVDLVVKKFSGRPHKDFRDFCLSIYNARDLGLDEPQRTALAKFSLRQELSGSQREIVFRVLGIYTQLKYGGEALRSLGELVAIPTVADRQDSRSNFKKAVKLIKRKAKKYGLKFSSIDKGGYLLSFPWRRSKGASMALYTRLDVSTVNLKEWQLSDGRRVDPFSMTKIGTKVYGRGTQSNKNAIVATMFAMRVIIEENIRLFNDIKLIVDLNNGFDHYSTKSDESMFFTSFDGSYPVELPKNSDELAQSYWVKALMAVALESLDIPTQAIPASFTGTGGEGVKVLQFGLAHPNGVNLTGQPLEYKELEKFLLDLQIVTEMIVRTGQMRSLD